MDIMNMRSDEHEAHRFSQLTMPEWYKLQAVFSLGVMRAEDNGTPLTKGELKRFAAVVAGLVRAADEWYKKQ